MWRHLKKWSKSNCIILTILPMSKRLGRMSRLAVLLWAAMRETNPQHRAHVTRVKRLSFKNTGSRQSQHQFSTPTTKPCEKTPRHLHMMPCHKARHQWQSSLTLKKPSLPIYMHLFRTSPSLPTVATTFLAPTPPSPLHQLSHFPQHHLGWSQIPEHFCHPLTHFQLGEKGARQH